MPESRAKLSQPRARQRFGSVARLTLALLPGAMAACDGGDGEALFRERPPYLAVQADCRARTLAGCGPEGLCEERCHPDLDAEQGGCQLSCEPHQCLSNDWTHGACLKCCADQAHATPDALSRCQRKCGALYAL
ncbi:MAG TPA: hypothetical protein VMF89_23475 [Polyangiales bacterium]|nr:hypothetical protein [Polyangiales bacterium]